MAENSQNLKEMNVQIQEAQNAPHKNCPKESTLRHIIIKLSKVKDKDIIWKKQKKSDLSHTRELL